MAGIRVPAVSSSPRRAVVAVLAAAILSAPAVASAQTSTIPENGADVSDTPPVPLTDERAGGGDGGGSQTRGGGEEPQAAAGALPDTGSDPRLLFLAGAALSLLGTGLRLRTADADEY